MLYKKLKSKYFVGSLVTTLIFFVILIFNSFVFPKVIASAPEKSEIKQVGNIGLELLANEDFKNTKSGETQKTNSPVNNIKEDQEDVHENKINYISSHIAIEIAYKEFQSEYGELEKGEYNWQTRLVEAPVPNNMALWGVVLNLTSDNYKTTYNAVINASTGEFVGGGKIALNLEYYDEKINEDKYISGTVGSILPENYKNKSSDSYDLSSYRPIYMLFDGNRMLLSFFELSDEDMKNYLAGETRWAVPTELQDKIEEFIKKYDLYDEYITIEKEKYEKEMSSVTTTKRK